jgi:NADH:ubiquinone oxidoreductase subunit 5 (subunit L)/multisubunit Na+/H+ antiporter MnhA subunit
MEQLLHIFLLIPFIGLIVNSIAVKPSSERILSGVAFTAVGLTLLSIVLFTGFWLLQGMPVYSIRDISLYRSLHYDFYLDFYFDRITAVYLLVGALLTLMVTVYSRYYLHREKGYKRFFVTVLFFYFGYNLTVLSGNIETLFIGWEILGISSFLLIAFYRQRYLPVKNAIKVFTIYRIGDVGLLLAMWMMHHFWHENIDFARLLNYDLVHEHIESHTYTGIFISLMILLAATAKSAQLPFTAWLPRAMEGPTPSSAIFYGSLSVHIGAFLLMRTAPFWEQQYSVRILIGLIGLSTALVATSIARVQSSIKSQIAYASAAQIGIIFIEIALGLEVIALIHFAGNAFLRTYQLLISPSTVTYLIREQFYNFEPALPSGKNGFATTLRNTIYMLAVREWYLDKVVFNIFFRPLKKARAILGFITLRNLLYFILPVYIAGFWLVHFYPDLPVTIRRYFAIILAVLALLMVAKAYNERGSSRLAWSLIIFGHLFIDLSISFNEKFDVRESMVYLSGVVVAGALGYWCLQRIHNIEGHRVGLNEFHGLIARERRLGFIFLLACLGLAGFPITPTFIGEDAIISHIHDDQFVLAALVAITFIINGIALIRIYARIFLGPHTPNYQEKVLITV